MTKELNILVVEDDQDINGLINKEIELDREEVRVMLRRKSF
ncbi:hypothetical protein [Clostridium sp.]|nr:hypothetical protein [Clostridium sp.]